MAEEPRGTVVIGTIGHDVHNIGTGLIQYALRKNGYRVVALGVAVGQKEFIDAAVETNADAVLVSSLSGMAEMECPGLRQKCVEAGLNKVLLYVGGKLVMGEVDWAESEGKFKSMGYDRVAPPGMKIETLLERLDADLAARRNGR